MDGEPIPGSASDPAQRLKAAYGMIFFVAGFNVLLGILARFVTMTQFAEYDARVRVDRGERVRAPARTRCSATIVA